MRAWRIVVPAAVAVALVSGCNRSEPIQTAQPATTTAVVTTSVNPDAGLWDPCTLPDSALAAAGLNTSTKEKDVAGVKFEGWKVCGWQDAEKKYDFTILSSSHVLSEIKQRSDYGEFVDTRLGGREAVQYRSIGSSHDYSCSIAAKSSFGTVDFDVLVRYSQRNGAPDPCSEVRQVAEALITEIPNH